MDPEPSQTSAAAEYVYRYGTKPEDLLAVTSFSSGLWRSPCIVVSTCADYDGILSKWCPTTPGLQLYRCLRTDFEAACAELGFGFDPAIQGEGFRLVGVKQASSSASDDLEFSSSQVHVPNALPPTFLAMWDHVGSCDRDGTGFPAAAAASTTEWCAPIRERLRSLAPNPDIALAAAWCLRELDVLCTTNDATIGTAFASPRGRVVLQWVVELLRLDAVACTMLAGEGTAVEAVNKLIGDLRAANPGVTHDPTGCFVFFTHAPSNALESFMRGGFGDGARPSLS